MDHRCKQDTSIERIEAKIDKLNEKIDTYLKKTTVLETKMGFISTGLLTFMVPILVGLAIWIITK